MLTNNDLGRVGEVVRTVLHEEVLPRLGAVEIKLDKVEQRLGSVEFRLGDVSDELDALSRTTAASFAHVEHRLDSLEIGDEGEDDFWLPPFRK